MTMMTNKGETVSPWKTPRFTDIVGQAIFDNDLDSRASAERHDTAVDGKLQTSHNLMVLSFRSSEDCGVTRLI